MPLYLFRCPDCQLDIKRILTPEAAKNDLRCKLGHHLERRDADVSVLVKEVIDNGLQTKRQEQLVDSPELFKEREDNIRAIKNKKGL
jgi:hypothetical protein